MPRAVSATEPRELPLSGDRGKLLRRLEEAKAIAVQGF